MAPSKRVHKCDVCKLGIGSQSSILCDICSLWVHASCAGISDDDMTKINELSSMSFICAPCKGNISPGGIRGEISSLNSKFDELSAKMDEFITKGNDDRNFMKQSFNDAVSEFKKELSSCVKELKSDIGGCNKLIKLVESENNAKITVLEAENNALYKKFNRSDIIIGGIPDCLKSVTDTIIDLASFYDIPITSDGHL